MIDPFADSNNPSLRRFNLSLNEYINIRFVSITETCAHASKNYCSTLAVLQLDAILTNAKVESTVRSKNNENQKCRNYNECYK